MQGEPVPPSKWKVFGGENDMVAGRVTILVATTEQEQRYAEKEGITQALAHEMALVNPLKMHGKESTTSAVPFCFCVEWLAKGPLGPRLQVNQKRSTDGNNQISATRFGNSTALPQMLFIMNNILSARM